MLNPTTTIVIYAKPDLYDLSITIDKRELPENFRYKPEVIVGVSQIPDDAKFKYFLVFWDTKD